ncbi:hypothetical protein FHU35_15450 [Saccharopolyspora dendranthemae]|uniref:Uncharacterized protein n=1 Tax=Saccharopolyspora dendranthemae TaxID=1181886 RepID=A0A561U2K2_9PSEU|nr:hypothetical protein FHU35_15450 [Saccharopolyspora dendranthemae]
MTLQQDAANTSAATNGRVNKPLTGDEYIESLKDGRESTCTARRSRTSPRTRRSATRCG